MAALLTSKSDKLQKISTIVTDCRRIGITVAPPSIEKSNKEFTPIVDKNEILFGLLAIKGLGESIVDKIISERPYASLKDFAEKVNDKSAIITLIKAGALPSQNKMNTLKKYAMQTYSKKEYKDVSSLPKLAVLKEQWGIDPDVIKNKEERLSLYNKKRRAQFEATEQAKYQKYMNDFYERYAQDEYMWEFDTLSIFLTNDPLVEANKYIKNQWEDVEENEICTVCCVITDIKRKKDKNGNQFAYLDLYTPYGIVEATIWSKQLKQYSDIVKKGKCVSILGRKREGDHLFVQEMKTYEQWLTDRKIKINAM